MSWLGVVMLSAALGLAAAGADELGRPQITVTASQDVGGAARNAAIVELADGRIAVANDGGMLLFDGARWRYFSHPDHRGGLWQLAAAEDGRIYGGFSGDLGYFADDGAGGFAWQSLRERVADADRVFDSVWSSDYDAGRHGVWFVALKRLFFYDLAQQRMHSAAPTGVFARGFKVSGDYWVVDTLAGLQHVVGVDPLQLASVPGADAIEGMLPLSLAQRGEATWLLLSNGQVRRYRDAAFEAFAPTLWPEFAARGAIAIRALRDDRIAVAFDRGAPLEIDLDGALVQRHYNSSGIPELQTYRLAEDRQGGLWLGQNAQITRIDRASGITLFDHRDGLPGADSLVRWQGQLYAGNSIGMYRLRAADGARAAHFERIVDQFKSAQHLALAGNSLIVGADALYRVDQDAGGTLRAARLGAPLVVRSMSASTAQPGRVWVGHAKGVLQVDHDDGQLRLTPVPGFDAAIYSMAEADDHSLWAADRSGAVWRIRHDDEAVRIDAFGAAHGLPAGAIRIYPGGGQPWFATNAGLRRFDAASGRFVVPPGLPPEIAAARVFCVAQDADGHLWLRGPGLTGVAWREREGWRWDASVLAAVNLNPTITDFVQEQDIHWVLRPDSLLRIDLAARRPLAAPAAPRTIAIDDLDTGQPIALAQAAGLPSAVRNLRIHYALPSLQRPEATLYRTQLSGVDRELSTWSPVAQRDYTNLPDGSFEFRIEARDGYGRNTPASSLPLGSTPPWWRSGAAIAAYLLGGVLALAWSAWLGARWRQRGLLLRQRQLEASVAERTVELSAKNALLAEQSERLTEIDRLKTRFFVNVGHEFRTPLTLVMGPLDDLLRDARERFSAHAREQLQMAHRNARRVLDLIVELLDVNRYEYGQMRLSPTTTDLASLLQQLAADVLPLVDRHGHSLQLDIEPGHDYHAVVDPLQIERALSNLISNAAKYMARGGCITLRLSRDVERAPVGEGSPRDAPAVAPRGPRPANPPEPATAPWLRIAVTDQGRGIPTAALPHVFDRFFQAEGGDRASGYGIGLALVREIAQAHGGQVAVSSTPGVGSCFSVLLPASAETLASAALIERHPATALALVAAAPEDVPMGDRPRILVVDDHDDMRARLRGLLAERFEVIEAADGPGAWHLLRDELPDLMVCDVMMPGFDGVELVRRARADADTAAIGVLLLTAKVGSEHAVAGLGAGADDYLAKPFDASELLARIDAILGHAQRLRLRLARETAPAEDVPAALTPDQRWCRRFDELIQAQLGDPALSVEALAAAMHSDRSRLFRKCKELLAASPSDYLRETRLKRARLLLQQDAGNVSEIAYAVGFESLSSFTRAFKARYGTAPSRLGRAAGQGAR